MTKDAKPHSMQPEETPELRALYEGFDKEHLIPLWTQVGDLMPVTPKPKAVPHVWRWSNILPLAQASGELVPVGRGGERRALGLVNPGLGGNAHISPTLWAAIQYLGPKEEAPEHRHSQNVPVRCRRRGRLDGGEWRSCTDEPGRSAAHTGMEFSWPSQ